MAMPKFTATQLVPYPPGKEPVEFPPEDMSQPRGQTQQPAAQSLPAPSMEFSDTDLPPIPVDPLAARQGDFVNQQREQLAQAMAEKDLSSEEKVAMALLSILPGLVGGIGGGIASGGYGAAAGLAGGLQGGAQGLQMMAGAKKERRQEALARARDLQDRIDKIDTQLEVKQDKAESREFSAREADKERVNAEKLIGQKQKFEREQESIMHKHAMGRDIFQAKSAMDRAKLAEQGDLQRAALSAKGAAPKLQQSDKDFYTNMAMMSNGLEDLENTVRQSGNMESKLIGDPTSAAKLESLPYQLAISYAKIVDPASVAREGEVEAAKKYMIPMGITVPNNVTLAAIKNMKDTLRKIASTRSSLGAPVPEELSTPRDPQANRSLKDLLGF